MSDVHPAFICQSEAQLAEYGEVAARYRHAATGADVLVLPGDDSAQVCALCFDTLPDDSSGIAHLLEHMIFRGSQKFPATNLYAALQQGSMQSALNASTMPDRTIYHFASPNDGDFANLLEVILDAVLHPLLRAGDIGEEQIVLRGEVDSYFASAVNYVQDGLNRGLHPGTVYQHSHGGEPDQVGGVTTEALRSFHSRFYHPSHARIFLSGPVDLQRRLAQIDEAFAGQGRRDPHARIVLPRIRAPRRLSLPHPEGAARNLVGMAWAFSPENPLGRFTWPCLDLALTSAPTGFLRERLQMLGAASGLNLGAPLASFSLLLDGQTEEAAEDAVREALAEAVAEVPVHKLVEAADKMELRLNEERGLAIFNRVLGHWRHGDDPLMALGFAAEIAKLRRELGDGDAIRDILARDLRDNPHRLTVELKLGGSAPSRPPPARRAASAPPVALPLLSKLPQRLRQVPVQVDGSAIEIAPRDGVGRTDLALGLNGLSEAQIGLLPLQSRCLAQAGLDPVLWAGAGPDQQSSIYLILRGKALSGQAAKLADRFEEALVGPIPEPATLMSLLAEETARQAARPGAFGHFLADLRLRAATGPAGAANELLTGLSARAALERLGAVDPQHLRAELSAVREAIKGRGGLRLATSCAEDFDWAGLLNRVGGPDGPAVRPPLARTVARDAIPVPLPFNTIGQSLQLDPDLPLALAAHALETGWLWDNLRVAGGAYGVRAWHDAVTGMLTQISARDPQLLQSLDRMAEAPVWIARSLKGEMLERCRVGAVARLDRPLSADAEALVLFQRHLAGISADHRQAELETVLRARDADMVDLADAMAAAQPGCGVVVLGAEATLSSALKDQPGAFTITDI